MLRNYVYITSQNVDLSLSRYSTYTVDCKLSNWTGCSYTRSPDCVRTRIILEEEDKEHGGTCDVELKETCPRIKCCKPGKYSGERQYSHN